MPYTIAMLAVVALALISFEEPVPLAGVALLVLVVARGLERRDRTRVNGRRLRRRARRAGGRGDRDRDLAPPGPADDADRPQSVGGH